jgi:hypothetical protein
VVGVPEPRDERARPPGPTPRVAGSGAAKPQIDSIIAQPANAERQMRARARIAAQDRHRRICRELERLAPLRRHYGPRPLLHVPLGALDARGRWAA